MASFKNILLIGATGSIGTVILQALEKEPAFTLTILQRASSTAQMPAHLETIRIRDDYPSTDLVAAFRGKDAVINCMTTLAVADQFRMIDAAIAAGVRRYMPSEFGLNNLRPEAQALSGVFRDKGKVQEYLRSKAKEGLIEWMSISCGMWIKWSMAHEFLGMHIAEKRMVFWDDGEGLFSCTTEDNTAEAIVRALKDKPDETKNTNVYLSDFALSQKQLLEAIERVQGVRYNVESLDSYALIKEKQAAVQNGDQMAEFALVETGLVTGRFGGHLEKEGVIMNERLGLPKRTLDEVVSRALKSVGAI